MKHLRLFENNGNRVYIVVVEYKPKKYETADESRNTQYIFSNEEVAIECYLYNVNLLKQELENINSFDIIDIESAEKWVDENYENGYVAYYYQTSIRDTFTIPDDFKAAIDAGKYNL